MLLPCHLYDFPAYLVIGVTDDALFPLLCLFKGVVLSFHLEIATHPRVFLVDVLAFLAELCDFSCMDVCDYCNVPCGVTVNADACFHFDSRCFGNGH